MSESTCSIEDCDRSNYARTWCSMHYYRWLRHGVAHTAPAGRGLVGSRNPNWQGDDVKYAAVHARIARRRGPAKNFSCFQCGDAARSWAYQHNGGTAEQICPKVGLPFATDLSCYQPMCDPCHNKFDAMHGWSRPPRYGMGTSLDKRRNRWRAYATVDGKQRSAKSYLTREEAVEAATKLRASLLAAWLAENPDAVLGDLGRVS